MLVAISTIHLCVNLVSTNLSLSPPIFKDEMVSVQCLHVPVGMKGKSGRSKEL